MEGKTDKGETDLFVKVLNRASCKQKDRDLFTDCKDHVSGCVTLMYQMSTQQCREFALLMTFTADYTRYAVPQLHPRRRRWRSTGQVNDKALLP